MSKTWYYRAIENEVAEVQRGESIRLGVRFLIRNLVPLAFTVLLFPLVWDKFVRAKSRQQKLLLVYLLIISYVVWDIKDMQVGIWMFLAYFLLITFVGAAAHGWTFFKYSVCNPDLGKVTVYSVKPINVWLIFTCLFVSF